MTDIDRRAALALGLAAASSLVVGSSEIALAAVGEETKLAEGVTVKVLGEGMSMITGYAKVRLRDLTVQPGATLAPSEMKNAMACHITEGEMEVDQDGKAFAAKKNHVWTCKIGTKEGVTNKGKIAAVMRIIDLLPASA
jgi:quercetin dioxygenase-like cupin family protein